MAQATLKGIKQVTAEQFAAETGNRAGYIWFVRTPATTGATASPEKGDIYLGGTHYGTWDSSVGSGLTARVNNIIATLGAFVDSNGDFVGAMPPTGAITSGATSITQTIQALEEYALGLNERLVTAEGRIQTARENITTLQSDMNVVKNDITTINGEITTINGEIDNLETAINSKVASVTAGNNSITIGGTTTAPTVAVKLDPATGNLIKETTNGLFVATPESKSVLGENAIVVTTGETSNTVSLKIDGNDKVLSQGTSGLTTTISLVAIDQPTGSTLASQYKLVGKNGEQLGATIDIGKDQFLSGTEYIHNATQDDVDVAIGRGVTGVAVGGSYLVFHFDITPTGTGPEDRWEYLDVKDLVGIYTAGMGINISGMTISAKIDGNSDLALTENGIGFATGYQAMSTVESTKLEGVEAGAEVNTIESINLNGEVVTPDENRIVNLSVNGGNTYLSGYTKPVSVGDPVAATDTVNNAIGKLETNLGDIKSKALNSVTAGNGISVNSPSGNTQTVSVKIANGTPLAFDGTGALFVWYDAMDDGVV